MKNLLTVLLSILLMGVCKSQTPTSGSFTVYGQSDRWYPVTFVDEGWDHEITSVLDITRFNVHTNDIWKGSMVAQIRFHSVLWGHASSFIDVDLKNYRQGYPEFCFPTGDFIAGWKEGSWGDNQKRIIIWLRGGGTTYNYKSNVTVDPKVYDDNNNPLPCNAYGGPYSYKTAVEPYVNIYGRNEQTAFFNLDRPNYFKGAVGIGSIPSAQLHVQGPQQVNSTNIEDQLSFSKFYYLATDGNTYGLSFKSLKEVSSSEWTGSGVRIASSIDGEHYSIGHYHNNLAWIDFYGQNYSNGLRFGTNNAERLRIDISGRVGIGTTTPSELLSVAGNIACKKLKVTQSGWPDYVFEPDYPLMTLDSVYHYIKTHKHLPGVATAKEITTDGLDIGGNQAILLQKIEELTLYIIQMKKEFQIENSELREKLRELRSKPIK